MHYNLMHACNDSQLRKFDRHLDVPYLVQGQGASSFSGGAETVLAKGRLEGPAKEQCFTTENAASLVTVNAI